jgi:hypothetical protein
VRFILDKKRANLEKAGMNFIKAGEKCGKNAGHCSYFPEKREALHLF